MNDSIEEHEKMYERIAPLVEKMRAKYPYNIDGMEPALTSDITEICLIVEKEAEQRGAQKERERHAN